MSSRLAGLASSAPALVLERSLGARAGVDSELWKTLPFAAEVIPDLPVASSWPGLLQAVTARFRGPSSPATASAFKSRTHDYDCPVQGQRPLLVQTVAAQLRSRSAIEEKLQSAAVSADGSRAADAVLCLSGSHPMRRLPSSSRWLQSSFSILRQAADLKQKGKLPVDLSLWAVENPLVNPPRRLEEKLAAGAEVIVTQPPLVWSVFESWYNDIHRSGLTNDVDVVIGLPFLNSTNNLRFWITLCDAWRVEGIDAVLRDFQQADAGGKTEMKQFCTAWNADLIAKVKALPDLGGVHVMPLSKSARNMAMQLLP